MGDWEHEATITNAGAGKPAPALERNDLVLEIGEQAIGRVFAEKQLEKAAETIRGLVDALKKAKSSIEKGEEYHKSCDLLSDKNGKLATEIDSLRKQAVDSGQKTKTVEQQREACQRELKKISDQNAALHEQIKGLEKAFGEKDIELAGLREKLAKKKPRKKAKKG